MWSDSLRRKGCLDWDNTLLAADTILTECSPWRVGWAADEEGEVGRPGLEKVTTLFFVDMEKPVHAVEVSETPSQGRSRYSDHWVWGQGSGDFKLCQKKMQKRKKLKSLLLNVTIFLALPRSWFGDWALLLIKAIPKCFYYTLCLKSQWNNLRRGEGINPRGKIFCGRVEQEIHREGAEIRRWRFHLIVQCLQGKAF